MFSRRLAAVLGGLALLLVAAPAHAAPAMDCIKFNDMYVICVE